MNQSQILDDVAAYYSSKIIAHGATPQGVDWNGKDSQELRFRKLCEILPSSGEFSVTDVGCGYGALLDYLVVTGRSFSYLGIDVSKDMIVAAEKRHERKSSVRFINSEIPDVVSDYAIASGIFNVRLHSGEKQWQSYVEDTLRLLAKNCRQGFAFNCLTSYSDADKKRLDLYYADPCKIFAFCKAHFSRHVALLHDYGLYEFTILVRKYL